MLQKYNNVDISELYSKFRIFQTKCDFLTRKNTHEAKITKQYKKKYEELKFSMAAGEQIKKATTNSRKVSYHLQVHL